jgi:hypothetical protein
LILSKIPVLNEQVDLTFTFSSVLDAPATTAQILLPKGARLIEGGLTWSGNLRANERIFSINRGRQNINETLL